LANGDDIRILTTSLGHGSNSTVRIKYCTLSLRRDPTLESVGSDRQ